MPGIGRLRFIDGLRGCTALYIVLHHIYLQRPEPGWEILGKGHFAVVVFIVISGFILALNAINRGDAQEPYAAFLRKRAARILPSYYGGLLFSIIMILLFVGTDRATHWAKSLPLSTGAILSSLVFLQTSIGGFSSKINHAYWFMPALIASYALFPALFALLRKRGPAVFLATSMLLACALFAFSTLMLQSYVNFQFIAFFCFGMWGAALVTSEKYAKMLSYRYAYAAVFGLVAYYALSIALGLTSKINMLPSEMLTAFASTMMIAAFMRGGGPVKRILEWKGFVALGAISYSLYLTHAPMIEVVDKYLLAPFGSGPFSPLQYLLVVATPVCIATGAVFYALVERRKWF